MGPSEAARSPTAAPSSRYGIDETLYGERAPSHLSASESYLVGCVHFGTDGVHGRPLLQTPGFLFLCFVGLPLGNKSSEQQNKNTYSDIISTFVGCNTSEHPDKFRRLL